MCSTPKLCISPRKHTINPLPFFEDLIFFNPDFGTQIFFNPLSIYSNYPIKVFMNTPLHE